MPPANRRWRSRKRITWKKPANATLRSSTSIRESVIGAAAPGRTGRGRRPRARSGERLEGDQREGVLDAIQRLRPAGDEAADVDLVLEVELHQQIVLTRGRMHLGHRLDVLDRRVGDIVGAPELALDHHEDGLHQSSTGSGSGSICGTGRRMNSGT